MNTTTDTKTDTSLQDHVNQIADDLTNWEEYCQKMISEGMGEDGEFSAYDWLEDALDIRYIVNKNREFISAQVLVAFGGPNIWVNFDEKQVKGYWWGSYAEANFTDNGDIEAAIEDLWGNY